MAYIALLDACVLYSATKTDLLMRLGLADLYRPRWTAEIHTEWMQGLAANRPDLPWEKLERRRDLMDANVRDGLVAGHMGLVPSLTLPDPDDRHVLAAAIVGRADVIVTDNLADFPPDALTPFGIDVQTPDEFLCHLLDLAPDAVCAVIRDLRDALGNPAMSSADYVASLERNGLPELAARLHPHPDRI